MSLDQNQQNNEGIRINITLCESCDPTRVQRKSRPQLLVLAYIVARIIFAAIVSVSEYLSYHGSGNKAAMIIILLFVTLIRIVVPTILLILFLRRRYAFMKGIIVIAILDALSLLQVVQSVVSTNFHLESLSPLSYIMILLHIISIIIAIYVNNSKLIREYCSRTPISDRQMIVNDYQPTSEEDLKKLVGIRGWLGLFAVYLCLIIVMTIAAITWFWMQMDARTGDTDFGSELSAAIFLGVLFYIFPLISLIRLSRRRIDFRNSYITGTTIDTIMFLILLVVPDGKIFRPFVPYMLLGISLMIVWGFYLFRSKRVMLSCPNGKPVKGARIDGYKWRKLY